MPRLLYVICSTSVVMAVLTGCGGSGTSPERPDLPGFPVTIARTGGIAGFQDVVVVAGDGVVSIARKGQAARRCQLAPATFKRLASATAGLPWSRITPADSRPSFPDDMVTTVQSPAGGPVRVGNPLVGTTGRVFVSVLNDLVPGPVSRQLCAPV